VLGAEIGGHVCGVSLLIEYHMHDQILTDLFIIDGVGFCRLMVWKW
jgi:hypothetical protein